MKKVIKVKLEPKSIEKAIKELEEYKADLERRVRLLVKTLTERGASLARAKVVDMGIIHNTNLLGSIEGFCVGNVGYVRVNDEYAMFFEFGTGPVGASKPHPLRESGDYKSDGWYTAADGKPMDRLYGWLPLKHPDGNIYYYTEGQKAKPFMYETALQLRDEFPEIVREVFG